MRHDELLCRLAAENPIHNTDLKIPAERRERLFHSVTAQLDNRAARVTAGRRKLSVSLSIALIATLVLGGVAIARGTDIMGLFMLDDEDIPAEIEETQALTPLPPGSEWNAIPYETDDTRYEVGVFVVTVQSQAECKWIDYWQDARQRGDTRTEESAMATIREIPDWKKYTEYTSPDSRDWFMTLVDQATAGDPSGLDQFAEVNCGGHLRGE